MMGAVAAEAMKLVRHRATWGLVWIFPLGVVIVALLSLALPHGHSRLGHLGSPTLPPQIWIAGTTTIWKVAASGPGRFLVGAFTALAFGGEYGWNTWKLIVPHGRRPVLIAAKYGVVLGLFIASWALAAALSVILGLLVASIGDGAPSGITLAALATAHAHAALPALGSTLLTMGYASVGAVVLRSTPGGAIVAVAAVVVEGLAGLIAPLINPMLFLSLPTYHLRNLQSFIETGGPASQLLSSGVTQGPWCVSLAVLGAWIVGLYAIAAVVFERQDLN